jgi:hypothetical protein
VLGQLMETRVYLALIPFVVMAVILLSHSGGIEGGRQWPDDTGESAEHGTMQHD